MGFLKKNLTGQHMNFMSQMLQQIWRLLGIKPPHAIVDKRPVWDLQQNIDGQVEEASVQSLDPLMFMLQEVPKACASFSPVKVLYGWWS